MNVISKYFNTLKYLKFSQFYNRFIFKFTNPKVSLEDWKIRELEDWKNKGFVNKVSFPKVKDVLFENNIFCFLNENKMIHVLRHKKDKPNIKNEKIIKDWNDKNINKLWLYNLHYFDFLRQENITYEQSLFWIEKWIDENKIGFGNGWEPYTLSLRIVNWIKFYLAGNKLNDKIIKYLALQTEFLSKKLEYHLLANHLLANAKALVFAGMFFKGEMSKKWLEKGIEIYNKQLPEQILNDGGHFERSAMYHSIILEDLLDLKNISAPLELDSYIKKMINWLSVMTGPDEKISLFNDAAFGIALEPKELLNYAEQLGFKVRRQENSCDLFDVGYARLQKDNWTIFCDGAPLGPDYQLGHSHADSLTFELWFKNERLICDSGTKQYFNADIRKYQRGTSAHNTIVIDGKNSSEVWSAHRVAKRAKIVERNFDDNTFSATHNGYKPILHKRKWSFENNEVCIDDFIIGKGTHIIESFFHIHPSYDVDIKDCIVKIFNDANTFNIKVDKDMKVFVSDGTVSFEFGKEEKNKIVCFMKTVALPFNIKTTIGVL